jgi:hypothetical protein
VNPECPAQLREKLVWFVGRNQMDIDGLGEQTIDQILSTAEPSGSAGLTAEPAGSCGGDAGRLLWKRIPRTALRSERVPRRKVSRASLSSPSP